MHVPRVDRLGRVPHQDRVAFVEGRAGALVFLEETKKTEEAGHRARVAVVMPQFGLRTEADPVLAPQSETDVYVLACRRREALVERKLLRSEGPHTEVQGRHVPELPPLG